MSTLRRAATIAGLLLVGTIGTCAALFVPTGPDPCAEPASGAATRPEVVRCVERYVRDQWYTRELGKLGALDSDPHGQGSWFDVVWKHRGTLETEAAALCHHPKDEKGALGHTALFEGLRGKGSCRAFAVTPLLGVSLRGLTCETVRASSTCIPRAAAFGP